MRERVETVVSPEKVGPSKAFLLAEPIIGRPEDTEEDWDVFQVPKGSEHWVGRFSSMSPEEERRALGNEYLDIVNSLRSNGVPFRFILAHRDKADMELVHHMAFELGVRGLGLDPSISSSCFPRDMMVDLDGTLFINPDANLTFPDGSGAHSRLGEGGAVLKSGKTVFVTDPRGYKSSTRRNYERDISSIRTSFQVGLLPWPVGVEVNTQAGTQEELVSHHIDRVAALIKGKDDKHYLLVDPFYFNEQNRLWGRYHTAIRKECRRLGVQLHVTPRTPDDVPYSLNLEQFEDGTVFMSKGHDSLQDLIGGIVGQDNVFTTERPVVAFPVLRKGGIRCMTLSAPSRIVGPPLRSE